MCSGLVPGCDKQPHSVCVVCGRALPPSHSAEAHQSCPVCFSSTASLLTEPWPAKGILIWWVRVCNTRHLSKSNNAEVLNPGCVPIQRNSDLPLKCLSHIFRGLSSGCCRQSANIPEGNLIQLCHCMKCSNTNVMKGHLGRPGFAMLVGLKRKQEK